MPLKSAAAQLLVDDLEAAIAFYRDRLGFANDFVYEGFYGAVSRDGVTLHLKCAPKLPGQRQHQRRGEHLDVFVDVADVRGLHEEFAARGVNVIKPLGEQPWGLVDFWVQDPDGYILGFSEALGGS